LSLPDGWRGNIAVLAWYAASGILSTAKYRGSCFRVEGDGEEQLGGKSFFSLKRKSPESLVVTQSCLLQTGFYSEKLLD
jgi:hypothetical protein